MRNPLAVRETLVVVMVLPALGGCGSLGDEDGRFRDRSLEYQRAQVVPIMQIPGNLDNYTLDQLYVIPEPIRSDSVAFEEVPMPKPIETRRREGVVIQSLAEKRWILIDATPGQVWPRIRDYWTELEIVLDYENPGAGIMETSWVELRSDGENRHKYRIAIEPGLHSGYSEIYVVHLQNLRTDPIPVMLTWPESSSSPDLELEMLRSISQFLADRNDIYQASSASLLAGTIEAASKANIIEDDGGEPVLELKLDYNRAWVQIRQALESAGVEIVDANREQSFFSVRFGGMVPEQESVGFFGRLLGRGNDIDERETRDFSLRLLEADSAVRIVPEALEAQEAMEEIGPLDLELLQVINDNLT